MNLFLAWNIFSFRKEIIYIGGVFLLVLLIPVIAVIVLTQTGINIVSDKLANLDVVNKTVQILNPLNGSVITNLSGPFTWPIHGVVTLEFGESDLPYQPFHTGIDIANKYGTPITPFAKGKVIYAGEISWGFGKHIVIDNGNNVTSIYAHLSEIDVSVGEMVSPGDIIGKEGDTGWTTGPHLHFQINVYGIPVNPRTFLGNNNP